MTQHEADADDWAYALALDELWEGEMVCLTVAGVEVLLLKLARDEVHAYDNRCPHAGARLSEGSLHALTLRCSWHWWEFDARSGAGINPRNCSLRRHPVKIVDGSVWVQLNGARPRPGPR